MNINRYLLCIIATIFMSNIGSAYAANIENRDIILKLGDHRAYVKNKLVYIDDNNKQVTPIVKGERTLVPVRFIATQYADDILWDDTSKQVTIRSGKNEIITTIGSNILNINGKENIIDTEATLINERTYLPLRAICEALGKTLFYSERGIIIISDTTKKWEKGDVTYILGKFATPIKYEEINYNGNKLNVIKLNPKDPTIGLKVELPNDKLNNTAAFSDIVSGKGAFAAINANFFTAYSEMKEPIGHVIDESEVMYGQSGLDSVLIMKNGDVRFTKPIIHVIGTTNGKADNVYLGEGRFDYHQWAAYGINALEQDRYSAILYTPARGDKVKINCEGYVITVEDGIVMSKVYVAEAYETTIPQNGYVVFIGADEAKLSMSHEAFKEGRTVQMRYRVKDGEGNEININDIKCAVSGGPLLVKDGEVVEVIPDSFSSDVRFTTQKTRRTAIGTDYSGNLMLVYTNKASIDDMKLIMKMLGAKHALNLDGGASSGMYYNYKVIAAPGRLLTTILYVYN